MISACRRHGDCPRSEIRLFASAGVELAMYGMMCGASLDRQHLEDECTLGSKPVVLCCVTSQRGSLSPLHDSTAL
eukprot:scaffold214072_cov36-Tisochrysis_lutea.AAC.2